MYHYVTLIEQKTNCMLHVLWTVDSYSAKRGIVCYETQVRVLSYAHLTLQRLTSRSHVTTEGQSVSQSWCQDKIFITVRQSLFCRCGGALSDEMMGLSFTAVIVSSTCLLYSQFYIVSCQECGSCGYLLSTVLHVTLVQYVQFIQSMYQSAGHCSRAA
jgi:hypothetical protein